VAVPESRDDETVPFFIEGEYRDGRERPPPHKERSQKYREGEFFFFFFLVNNHQDILDIELFVQVVIWSSGHLFHLLYQQIYLSEKLLKSNL
jgi:hypothetical protein